MEGRRGCDWVVERERDEVEPDPVLPSIASALANGYFDVEGLRVAMRFEPTGRDALTAVMERRADVATVADVPIMFAAMAQ